MIFTISVIFVLVLSVQGDVGPCFHFDGKGYLEYQTEQLNIRYSAHYNFTFKTNKTNGILLFARGTFDHEGIFILGGKLHYLLYNAGPNGLEGTRGVHLFSNATVSNNTWINVEVFRNIEFQDEPIRRGPPDTTLKTGLIVRSADVEEGERHIVVGPKDGVSILKPIFLGGTKTSVSTTLKKFEGQIRDIHEHSTGLTVHDASRNMGVTRCLGGNIE